MAFAFVARRNAPQSMASLFFKQNIVGWYFEVSEVNNFTDKNVRKSNLFPLLKLKKKNNNFPLLK